MIPLPETVDNRLITEKFVQYIGSGQFKGTKRYYIKGENNIEIDIKTGKTMNEIKSVKYSIEDYESLEKSIGAKNMYFFKEYISFQNKNNKVIDELLKDY